MYIVYNECSLFEKEGISVNLGIETELLEFKKSTAN